MIFTNQGGIVIKKNAVNMTRFKTKVEKFLTHLDIPMLLYASTAKNDNYRKPRSGLWTLFARDIGLSGAIPVTENAVFVGDAAGRQIPKDFSACDRLFAENLGILFQTPEEYFEGKAQQSFAYPLDLNAFIPIKKQLCQFKASDALEMVVFVGMPASGKSTFYQKYIELHGHARINQDTLKSLSKCLSEARKNLEQGVSVCIDNTNRDRKTRSKWIDLAAQFNIKPRCIHFKTPLPIARHNNAVRTLSGMVKEKRDFLPAIAFGDYEKKFQPPELSEGFSELDEIDFKFEGTEEERKIWSKWWDA